MGADDLTRERLFHVLWDGGYQPIGAPFEPGEGGALLQGRPMQFFRLLDVLETRSVKALMLIMHECYRPGQRIEIPGWSAQWLKDRGFSAYDARLAASELGPENKGGKGYIRVEKINGQVTGKQMGIVVNGLAVEVDDPIGEERRDGRPRAVRAISANGPQNPVDNPVRRFSTNENTRIAETQQTGPSFAQVTPVGAISTIGSSSPSSRDREEDRIFFSDKPKGKFPFAKYLTQPALSMALVQRRGEVLTALSAGLTPFSTQAKSLLEFFDESSDDSSVAYIVTLFVDTLAGEAPDWAQRSSEIRSHLRAHNINISKTLTGADLCGAYAIALVTALSAGEVKTWGGWMSSMVSKQNVYDSPAITAVTSVVDDLLADRPFRPTTGESPASTKRWLTAADFSDSYLAELRAAAARTSWVDDDIMFEKLLNNPRRSEAYLVTHRNQTG